MLQYEKKIVQNNTYTKSIYIYFTGLDRSIIYFRKFKV